MGNNPIIQFFNNLLTLQNTFDWKVVQHYLFSIFIVQGVILTVILSVLAQLLGSLIGLLLYFARRSRFQVVRGVANVYIWFFRGTPLVVQILAFSLLIPNLKLYKPLNKIDIFTAFGYHNVFFAVFVAALAALSLNEGAYMSEIVRAGIDSIDAGQMEAAKSLGMTYWKGMQRVVLPQAMRVIIPPLGNEFNNMLKSSSLAAFISLNELLGTATNIGAANFRELELLVTASFWYLALTTVWGFVQAAIERKFNASNIDPSAVDRMSWWKRGFGLARKPVPVMAPETAISEFGDRR